MSDLAKVSIPQSEALAQIRGIVISNEVITETLRKNILFVCDHVTQPALEARNAELEGLLREAKGVIINHHMAGYREPGRECEFCTQEFFDQIKEALSHEQTGSGSGGTDE